MAKETQAKLGVQEAWAEWLHDHPISVPEMIEDAIEKAFSKWLDTHEDSLLEQIAVKVAENVKRQQEIEKRIADERKPSDAD